jgi:hypothetical protein
MYKSEKNMLLAGFAGCLVASVLIPVIAAYMIFSMAFVLPYLWLWFIVPLGAAPIGMAHAYGLATVLHFFVIPTDIKADDRDTDNGKAIALLLRPWIALLVGYITHLCM